MGWGRSRWGLLLRSDGSQPSKLEGVEVITCPPLGLGTGKNGDIAGTIIIEVFNAPILRCRRGLR